MRSGHAWQRDALILQDFPRFLRAKITNCLYYKQIDKTTSENVVYAVVG